MRRLLSIALFFCLLSSIVPVRGEFLNQARDRFAHGEYESAITFFEKHLQSSPPSASAYYELGQALQKSEKNAEAALSYRRSLLLDPRFIPASEALREVNAQLGISAPMPDWQSQFAEKIASDPLALVGVASFWVGAFTLLAAFVFSKKRTGLACAGSLLLIVGLAACLLAALTDPRIAEARQAMVMKAVGASLYKVPSEDAAEKITTLQQGSAVRILSTRGRWFHAELPGGQRGWFLQEAITPIIPSI